MIPEIIDDQPTKIITIYDTMPPHPTVQGAPAIWADPGDEWLFRRTTNLLIPKIVDSIAPTDPKIRYVVCAIRRLRKLGMPNTYQAIDMVMWQEVESLNEDKKTATINSVLCFGPSRVNSVPEMNKTVNAIMIAFEQVYKDPRWISQYEMGGVGDESDLIEPDLEESPEEENADVKP